MFIHESFQNIFKKIWHEKNTPSISFIKRSVTMIKTIIIILGHYELTKLGKYWNLCLKSDDLVLADVF